ncbi:MAG: hypothetical protein R2838_11420 [Caldilineaceae bacterium]
MRGDEQALLPAPVVDAASLADAYAGGFVRITGRGEPATEVEVAIDETVIGRTQVDADRTWSFLARLPQAGAYTLNARTVGGAAAEPIEIDVAAQAPSTPTPAAVAASTVPTAMPTLATLPITPTLVVTATAAVTETVAMTPAAPMATTVVTTTVARAPAINVNALQPGRLGGGLVELQGSGEPGSAVEVTVDDVVIGRAQVDAAGFWSLVARLAEPGSYALSVRSADGAASAPVTIEIQATATLEPTATPEPTDTPTPEPAIIDTPVPTETATATPEATDTATPARTDTPEPTDTATPAPTDTETPAPTDTPTETPEPTATDTATTRADRDGYADAERWRR